MPLRLATLAVAFVLFAGCGAQPEAPEPEVAATEIGPEEEAAPRSAEPLTGTEGAVVATGLDGTWNIVMTPKSGGEAIRGAWKIEEGGDNRFIDVAGGSSIEVTERTEDGNAFSISGVVNTGDGPVPFQTNGTLDGNTMEAESVLEGMGDFALTGTRRAE